MFSGLKRKVQLQNVFVIIFYNVMSNFMNFKEKSERKAVLTKGVGIDLLLELYEVRSAVVSRDDSGTGAL